MIAASRSQNSAAASTATPAHATGIRRAVKPAAATTATAFSIPAVVPDSTHCVGEFQFATTTPSQPATSSATFAGSPATAAIVPGSAPAAATITSPRAADSV